MNTRHSAGFATSLASHPIRIASWLESWTPRLSSTTTGRGGMTRELAGSRTQDRGHLSTVLIFTPLPGTIRRIIGTCGEVEVVGRLPLALMEREGEMEGAAVAVFPRRAIIAGSITISLAASPLLDGRGQGGQFSVAQLETSTQAIPTPFHRTLVGPYQPLRLGSWIAQKWRRDFYGATTTSSFLRASS